MNKQRMYRGKRKDAKEIAFYQSFPEVVHGLDSIWAVGYYFEQNKRSFIYEPLAYPDLLVKKHSSEVHPDSVSQSTGRFDKNGVEIFGGDADRESGGKVVWNQDSCAFLFDHPDELMELVDTEKWFEVIPEGSEE